MGKVWVLDSGTKGTGASMVPLDKVLESPRSPEEPLALVPLGPARPEPPAPPEARPRIFRVVDVVSGQVMADDATAAVALRVLERFRSAVDVRVYVWSPEGQRWRLLTFRELKALWDLRGRLGRVPAA